MTTAVSYSTGLALLGGVIEIDRTTCFTEGLPDVTAEQQNRLERVF